MSFIDRLKNKIRVTLYKTILRKYAYGNRIARSTWEKQFSDGFWDYLYSPDEAAHYEAFVGLFNQYTQKGAVLDAGCGQGVLYNYLKKNGGSFDYLGIDISAEAVAAAGKASPETHFKQVDFDKEKLEEKFDVVMFNETLSYFVRPVKKIATCIEENLKPGGYMMISLCDYIGHDEIWTKLKSQYDFLDFKIVENDKGQKWKMGIFKP